MTDSLTCVVDAASVGIKKFGGAPKLMIVDTQTLAVKGLWSSIITEMGHYH